MPAEGAMRWKAARALARLGLIGLSVLACASATLGSAASAQTAHASSVAEAAQRFSIPAHWIVAVMRRESGLRSEAVSPAGAIGLMQVMPKTYAELRGRYGLGADPFHPRDNILAGAAYLREMLDRFGAPGFLGAYNAGPERYQDYLNGRRPLPKETRDYLAALAPIIGGAAPVEAPPPEPPLVFIARDRSADLFVAPVSSSRAP